MKKNNLNKLLFGVLCLSLVSCDINSWNDHLDGFEGDSEPTDVKTIEYTLTDADYATLAANKTNIALAGNENKAALTAVGKNHAFSATISARDYVPAFLSDPKFGYFALSDGSAIKMTYNVATNLPEETTNIAKANKYEISETDYKEIWGSETDFVTSFAPSKPAAKSISKILLDVLPDAEKGAYAIVNYNTSSQEPVFGSAPTPPTPSFVLSSVIGTAKVGDTQEIRGIITAVCNQGYILTDNSGSILVYFGSTFTVDNYAEGDQIIISGTIGAYNTGLQVVGSSATEEKADKQTYTYPTPVVYTGADLDAQLARTENTLAIYCQVSADVTVSGNYYNFNFDGATTAVGSLYQGTPAQKELFGTGGKFIIKGYFISVSKSGGAPKYCNFVVTDVKPATASAKRASIKAEVIIPKVSENAVYYFDGTAWAAPSNVVVLNPADYTEMGQKYGNLSAPNTYLPTFLKVKFPYAQAETTKFVLINTMMARLQNMLATNMYLMAHNGLRISVSLKRQLNSLRIKAHGCTILTLQSHYLQVKDKK
ncbi:MAG: OB-fold nucleic acid binding domain-containing protein [Muribaculaceae bacterium]|nr:OB-fold nucleic acid binding domain-containing protein [Muribaculaceae bacterium]